MATPARPLRFGLVGTGYWARATHAPALASTEGVEFAAVWGRNRKAAESLAAGYGASAYGDLDLFLASIDAVAFSVPPDVQSPIAARAARTGKHVLLEKPIAISQADANDLVSAVQDGGVASVVFFTARFRPGVRAWLAGLTDLGSWDGGFAVWLGTALRETSPFNTPWRREKGGLWDVGPHVVSLLWACLGPVTSVTADAGRGDLTYLVLHHEGGATSTATVSVGAPDAAAGLDLYVWGEHGRSVMPADPGDPVAALRVALTELAGNARSGHLSHPCDVRFGRDVGHVLAEAQRQLDALRGSDGSDGLPCGRS
jgi:predicted dehydrogenase